MSQGSERSATVEQIKSEVKQTIDELRMLARADIPFEQFCQTLLSKVVPLTGAHGGIIWQFKGEQGFQPLFGFGPKHQLITAENHPHQQMLTEVARKQQPLCVPGASVSENAESAEMLLIAVPILDRQSRSWGSLELLQRNEISEETQKGYVRFTSQLATLFPRWQEQHDLRSASSTQEHWAERVTFMREVHRSVDLTETAYAIANETRRLLHADRVALAVESGGKYKLKAVSSQDRFDNRANVVKKLNHIATNSIKTSTPLWLTGDTSDLPPKLAQHVNEYLDESHSRTFAVVPLLLAPTVKKNDELKRGRTLPSRKIGGLIIEYFDQEVDQAQIEQDLNLIKEESTQALGNSLVTNEIFLLPLLRAMGRIRDNLWTNYRGRTIAAATAIALAIGLLIFYPAQMRLKIDGVLQPEIRKNLFSPMEARVVTVHFDHGETVKKGELLLTLKSEVLEEKRIELMGQIETLQEQVSSLDQQILGKRDVKDDDRMLMAANREQLAIQKEGLEKSLVLIDRQMELLKIYSPINGTVITWEARKRLEDLPVSSNQPLLSVADLNGPWQVDLMIPQSKVGYVKQAQVDSSKPLDADFLLATNPTERHRGQLLDVSERAENNSQGMTEYRARIAFDASEIEHLNVAAGVTSRVNCGRKSLGFVWFYQVYDFLRTRVFF
ncbi:MAG: GAF domain-containing protein [Pirellulaceae bacterium]